MVEFAEENRDHNNFLIFPAEEESVCIRKTGTCEQHEPRSSCENFFKTRSDFYTEKTAMDGCMYTHNMDVSSTHCFIFIFQTRFFSQNMQTKIKFVQLDLLKLN